MVIIIYGSPICLEDPDLIRVNSIVQLYVTHEYSLFDLYLMVVNVSRDVNHMVNF